MSAFTPYKDIKRNRQEDGEKNLQDILKAFICTSQPEPKEEMRGAGFLVKNLLKDTTTDQQNQPKETDLASRLELFVSNLGKSSKGHQCLYCGKIYSRKYGLKIHIRTHTGYKPLQCRICLRPFGDPSNLNKHIRLHSEGNAPYKCDECGKVLVRRRDLERHIVARHSTQESIAINNHTIPVAEKIIDPMN